ncbi:hypothetical protein EC973_006243 [Apophysomyces ossiformis]|uniref:FAR1 domain-containing protein n=1 Tax=Apophysomyces ossiformis TaxID=679940 RepID=A0A8H7BIL7_9FUNG|nr:hypothetical protein EC973_006243 [Apophysomyces ossiformis]
MSIVQKQQRKFETDEMDEHHVTDFLTLVQVTENNVIRERMYLTKEEIRSAVNAFGAEHNIVFSTKSSNEYTLVLTCKHAGTYRIQQPLQDETEKQKRNKSSQKIGCGCFIKAKPSKTGGWYIHQWESKHNHAIPREETSMQSIECSLKKLKRKLKGFFVEA